MKKTKRKMRNDWKNGFLGFFSFFSLRYFITGEWLYLVWVLWAIWFTYFIPLKKK